MIFTVYIIYCIIYIYVKLCVYINMHFSDYQNFFIWLKINVFLFKVSEQQVICYMQSVTYKYEVTDHLNTPVQYKYLEQEFNRS